MHDGDKVQLALLDFIDDPSVSTKTKSRAYLDFQLKNHTLGDWDNERGMYKSFYGSLLTTDHTGKEIVTKLSSDKETALGQIEDILGLSEEQLNMRTKSFNAYSHAVYERARKELKKHYNSIYEMMSVLQSEAKTGKLLSGNEVGLVRGVMDIAKQGVKSNIARQRIHGTYNVLNAIERGNIDVSSFIGNMDLVGQTATYLLRKGMYSGNSSEELYKKTVKEIDKFISRGNFDEFYKQSSTKAIFDELTGQRNTGLTHTYATKLMMGSVELSKIDPSDVMSKIAPYAMSPNLNINVLSEMKRKQEYYSLSMDLLVDNMIESAISAKHGLTLGGLEGSKIFINELLNYDSDNLNNKVIQMFDDVFINNDQIKKVNLLENMLFYKQGFDKREGVLETIRDEVSAKGLNTDIFMKQFDLGSEEFKSSFKDLVTEKEMNTYLAFGKRYRDEVRNIEMDIFNHGMKDRYVNVDEYKIFQGLNLFGELLIQNDPGLEYDSEVVSELFEQYNAGKISYSDLMKNSDVQNLTYQAQISLGSAASISNVGKMREYLTAFVNTSENQKEWNQFAEDITAKFKSNETNKKFLNKYDISEIFDGNFRVKHSFKNKVNFDKELLEVLGDYENLNKTHHFSFQNKVMSNGADPMKAYLEVMNNNYTIFNQSGYDGGESLDILKSFKENTTGSLNTTSLDESLENIDKIRAKTIRDLMDKMTERDKDFQTFNTDELMRDLNMNPEDKEIRGAVLGQVKKAIDDTLFFLNKDKMADLKLGDESKMVKIRFADKLSDTEENLKKWGKLYQIGTKRTQTSSPINRLFDLLEADNRNFIIDDLSIFHGKRGFEQKQFNKVYEFAKTHNLYFSESIARQVFDHRNMASSLMSSSERTQLAQSLLNAKRYLGEDFTRENVIKRMNQKLDLNLSTITAVNRFMYDNPELNKGGFKTKLQENLGKILKDFSFVDKSITNDYINPNYIKMAKSYVDSNRTYRTVGSAGRDPVRFDIARKSLKNFIKEKREWLEENNIDTSFFEQMALSELTNQKFKSNSKVKNILTNVARALSNQEVSDIGDIGKTFNDLNKKIPKNAKKYGIAAVLASGVITASASFVKPFLTKGNGTYTLSNNVNNLDEKQIMEKLNFANGMKANMITEELKGLSGNAYVSVNKKSYF